MKIRNTIIVLTIVTLVLGVSAFAKKELGDLSAPTNFTIDDSGDPIYCDWDDVLEATKYCVNLEGMVTFDYVDGTGAFIEDETLDVEVCFGTSDRTDGGLMGDSYLNITLEDLELALIAAIQDALGLPPQNLIALSEFDSEGKVKALNPGNGNGRQNNEFSNTDGCYVIF